MKSQSFILYRQGLHFVGQEESITFEMRFWLDLRDIAWNQWSSSVPEEMLKEGF